MDPSAGGDCLIDSKGQLLCHRNLRSSGFVVLTPAILVNRHLACSCGAPWSTASGSCSACTPSEIIPAVGLAISNWENSRRDDTRLVQDNNPGDTVTKDIDQIRQTSWVVRGCIASSSYPFRKAFCSPGHCLPRCRQDKARRHREDHSYFHHAGETGPR